MSPTLFIQILMAYVGAPYKFGGNTPQGIDCSGLVEEALSILGCNPPGRQKADDLYRYFSNPDKGIKDSFVVGALAFYGTEARVTHVGVLVSLTHIIEARGGDETTLTLADAVAKNAFVGIRPLRHRSDLVAVIQPRGLPWETTWMAANP